MSPRMAVALMPALVLACTSTRTVETRSPAGSATHLELAAGTKGPILYEWKASQDGVEGDLAFARCVEVVEDRERIESKRVTGPDPTLNGLLLAGGAVAAAAGGVMYSSGNCSDKDTENYSDDCKAANVTLMSGLVGGAVGLLGFTMSSRETPGPFRISSTMRKGKTVPCARPGAMQGITLELRAGSLGTFSATPDASGHAQFSLPSSAEFDTSTRYPVVITSLEDTRSSVLREGMVLALLNLEPYAKLVRARQSEAFAVGDQAEFEGVVHGDSAARDGFTTECSPTGSDVCFDAIDNDCDGLYDLGCGYQSGALQWTLAWRTGDDLDLHVIGPDRVHVWYRNKQGAGAGLQLDVDCLGQFGNNCLAQNVENIFTPRTRAPMEGTYRGWVEVFQTVDDDNAAREVVAMLGGRIAGKTFRMPMRLQAQKGVRVYFAFAIGKDRDKDSVIDRQDACPDLPGVYSDFARENGCPDQDMDGVADKEDACPSEPGIRSNETRNNGCARAYGHARFTSRGVEIDEDIHFATGSAQPLARSYPVLRDVARVMREQPEALRVISIQGHTDDVGEEDKNYALSRERVRAVLNHLVTKEGLPAARLHYAWFGEARPKIPAQAGVFSEAARAANRRVEFVVESPEPQITVAW